MHIVSVLNDVRQHKAYGGVSGDDAEGDFGVVEDGNWGHMLDFEMCAFDED